MQWLFLSIAILSEVIATSALQVSAGFTRFTPSLIAIIGYGLAFYFLSLTLKTLPMGIAYAIWSGVGVVLISCIGWMLYGQKIDSAGMVGIALIAAGVMVINLCSKTMENSAEL